MTALRVVFQDTSTTTKGALSFLSAILTTKEAMDRWTIERNEHILFHKSTFRQRQATDCFLLCEGLPNTYGWRFKQNLGYLLLFIQFLATINK